MLDKNQYCIILAGGTGTRFWPYSRFKKPKQFLDILNTGKTLIQQTYERIKDLFLNENIYVVTHEDYFDLVSKQLPEIKVKNIITEPLRKNTATCIAYVTHKINKLNPESKMMFCPSDHLILNNEIFKQIIKLAFDYINKYNDVLLTIGLKPHKPESNYGYIQVAGGLSNIDFNKTILKIKTFIEKPDKDLAKVFLDSGDFLWNSGIFIWSSKTILKAFSEHLPDIHLAFSEINDYLNTEQEEKHIYECYSKCKNISIDYGILEKSNNVYVLCANFEWSDLGSWSSLEDFTKKDKNSNIIISKKNVFTYNTKDIILYNHDKEKLIVIEGLNKYIVTETKDVLLICSQENEHLIKRFINDIKIEGYEEYL